MKTTSALCANDIKKLLKTKFPTIKFSVRSENFSGGNSVDISWNLGPVTKEIDAIVNGFEYGTFDGMTDCYNYDNVREGIHQAKYVHCQRDYHTEEEELNMKLHWKDPNRKNLWKEEKTLYHIIGKDLCKAMNIEYQGLNMRVPDDFQHMIRGYYNGGSLQDLIYQLAEPTPFITGYHGVKHKKCEETGENISNSFELY